MVLAAVVVGVAGCGGSGTDRFLSVEGTVRYQGKPLSRGAVIFSADAEKGNKTLHEPRGSIDADGRYKITTHPREGAPAGWYKVGVLATEPSDAKNPYSLPRSLIPEEYGKPDQSQLRLEVRPDAPPGAYDLDLK